MTIKTQPILCATAATVFTVPLSTVGVKPREGLGVGGGSVSGEVVVVVVEVVDVVVGGVM